MLQSAYEIFYKAVNAVRSGIEVVKELDLAMTEMKKVTHESQQALDTFAKKVSCGYSKTFIYTVYNKTIYKSSIKSEV